MEKTTEELSQSDGWIIKSSKRHPDRVYYFNINSGVSTWDKPVPVSSKERIQTQKHTNVWNKQVTDIYDEIKSPNILSTEISSDEEDIENNKVNESDVNRKSQKRNLESEESSENEDETLTNCNSLTVIETSVITEKKICTAQNRENTSILPSKNKSPKLQTASANSKVNLSLTDSTSTPTANSKVNPSLTNSKAANSKASPPLKKNAMNANSKIPSVTKSPKTTCASNLKSSSSVTNTSITNSSTILSATKSAKNISATNKSSTNINTPGRKKVSFQLPKQATPIHSKSLNTSKKGCISTESKIVAAVERSKAKKERRKNSRNLKKSASLSSSETKVVRIQQNASPLTQERKTDTVSDTAIKIIDTASKDASEDAVKNQSENSDALVEMISVLPTPPSDSIVESDDECIMDYEDFSEEKTEDIPSFTETSFSQSNDEDIEMLDISRDSALSTIPSYEDSLLKNYFIVLDTNVLLRKLDYIYELKNTPVNGCGPPHFLIPWVVLQELDSLKKNKNGRQKEIASEGGQKGDFGKAVRLAISFLNSMLKSNNPRFHTQHPYEAEDFRKDFRRNNDDKILQCCLWLVGKGIPQEKIILYTFDKNLYNKAIACNIICCDGDLLKEKLIPDLIIKDYSYTDTVKSIKSSFASDHDKAVKYSNQKSQEVKFKQTYKEIEMKIHTLMLDVREMLRNILDPLFEKEMDEAYGDAWHFFPIQRHILKGILQGIVKYWRTVFALIFDKEDKSIFEFLLEKAKNPDGFTGKQEECLALLSNIEDFLFIIKRKYPQVTISLDLNQTKKAVEEEFLKLDDCEKSLLAIECELQESEVYCVLEVLNYNWNAINYLCGCCLDFCGISHDIVYAVEGEMPPQSVFKRVIPDLQRSLFIMKNLMKRIIDNFKTSRCDKHLFKEFYKALIGLLPSLDIEFENPILNNFTPVILERFCRLPEHRSRFEDGYKQLLYFHEKLGKAVYYVLNNMY
ncbi:transcriptional protein SWT1 [Caerostris darwini]|uniref:Transcriptional protein SWT1 n=1 Tax=Caerostris darwini TaxID=1538125 RepID=A0AAV4NLB8_9ARAC|nr:transcriptional protein SWT1 [Caerostris darwini]